MVESLILLSDGQQAMAMSWQRLGLQKIVACIGMDFGSGHFEFCRSSSTVRMASRSSLEVGETTATVDEETAVVTR